MRYSVPVNAACEVAALAGTGADELYCGYQDAWWTSRYGDHDSATRRQGAANLASMTELQRTAQAAREHDVPLYLALNARYTEPQLDHLVGLCDAFAQMGGTGVIASDLGLLWRLRGRRNFARTLSLLAVAQNAPTLRVFRELGVSRVVFPRFVCPEEAGRLLAAVPGMQGEVMVFFDKCPLVDGYCRHRHGVSYPDLRAGEGSWAEAAEGNPGVSGVDPGEAPASRHGLDVSIASRESCGAPDAHGELVGAFMGHEAAAPLFTFDTTYRTHACLGTSCRYLEPNPCGACFLARYQSAGVGFAKLGGRGRPFEERLRALRFLKQAETAESDAERRALYQQTFGQDCACYYGDAIQSRFAIEPVETTHSETPRRFVGSQTSFRAFCDSMEREIATAAHSHIEGNRHRGSEALTAAAVHPHIEDGWQACGRVERSMPATILVPPLSDEGSAWLRDRLPMLASVLPAQSHLCVNDIGTLVELARANREAGWGLLVTMGTLLARMDDPAEVAHFMDPQSNPPRLVWGPDGSPRTLTYAPPPDPLVRHWLHPSAGEPSAQAALRALTGEPAVPCDPFVADALRALMPRQ